MTKIYTKTGDTGLTGLLGGKRVLKSDLRINCFGTVDELNSWIGLLSDYTINAPHLMVLKEIQDRLFTIGANLATETESNNSKIPILLEQDITLLENEMDKMNELLEPMKAFILPGGHKEVSSAHIARTVCRRAERISVQLHETEGCNILIIKYLNRLSDYLFILCRDMSRALKVAEILWLPRK